MEQKNSSAKCLAILVTALMFLQALTGLFFSDSYRDNLFVRSAWFGNDLITLVAAIPLMVIALVLDEPKRNAERAMLARLVWLGGLAYAAYNYSFYLFGAAFNSFFLLYVALFAASGYGLCIGLAKLEIVKVEEVCRYRRFAKGISVYMVIWALVLGSLWIAQSLGYIFTGEPPAMVATTGHPTNITGALDLSMMVPAVFLGAILLWKQKPWGFILALVMNVKGALYTLVLATSSLVAAQAGIEGVRDQILLWIALFVASAVCCLLLLRPRGRFQP